MPGVAEPSADFFAASAVDPTALGPALLDLQARAEAAAATGAATFALPGQPAASYHELLRHTARALLTLPATEPVYVPKVAGELEPLLALWPAALVVPTTTALSARALIELRAFPVHPLGVMSEVAWADGRWCSPAEYFFHDLDHARYKLRADLALEGIELPDPYQSGTTLDPHTGQHRIILPAAVGHLGRIGRCLWQRAPERLALARHLLQQAATLPAATSTAAELLLFEVLHEKSHALDRGVLARELESPAHGEKLARKYTAGFFGAAPPTPEVIAALSAAGRALRESL